MGNFIKLFDISKYFFLNYSNKASLIKQSSSSSQILLLVTAAQIPDKPIHQNKELLMSLTYISKTKAISLNCKHGLQF